MRSVSEALAIEYDRRAPYANRDELIDEICERLAEGEALASIVRDAHMPGWVTVYTWRDSNPETAERFARAREAGEEAMAARMRAVADGKQGYSTGDVQRDKLIIDTDFKLLAKFNPKRWGESTQLRHADADGAKLDTAPLVGELLSLMAPGVANTGAPAASRAAPVTYRDVTPAPAAAGQVERTQHNARPAYRPRVAHDVDDLV